MLKNFKSNIKYLNKKFNIAKILNINEQSLKNKLSDEKRQFSLIDAILISQATGYKIDDLVFKDLDKKQKEEK